MTPYQIISKLAHILGTAITCSAFWYAGGPNHHMLVYGGLGWLFFTLSVEGTQLDIEWNDRYGSPLRKNRALRQSVADAFFWNTLGFVLYCIIWSIVNETPS